MTNQNQIEELASLNQWTDCLPDNNGKRPRLSPGSPQHGLSYSAATTNATASTYNYGFLFSQYDQFIGIDVDVDPSGQKTETATTAIPPALLLFLHTHPTHVHFSPSGHGLHLIYKVTTDAADKLNAASRKQGAVSIANGALYTGDWRWDSSFLTFTTNLHPLSAPISTIDYDTLCELIPFDSTISKPESNVIDFNTRLTMQTQVPALEDLTNTLAAIPSTFNHMAKRACARLTHSKPSTNYEYWLLVGSACAHVAAVYEAFSLNPDDVAEAFLVWSQKDPEFVSDADVLKKFQSLLRSTKTKVNQSEATATFKTLSSLAQFSILNFPKLTGKALTPDANALLNYEYLMDFHDLTIWMDTMGGGYSFKGPEEVIAKWFCKKFNSSPRDAGTSHVFDARDLGIIMLPFFQDQFKQSVTAAAAGIAAKHLMQSVRTTNAFKDWIDSKPWDGVSRLDSVVHSISYQEDKRKNSEIYDAFIRKSLLAMIGIHYWPEDRPKIPALLVLTGPQFTFKSSWAEWLIPLEMADYLGMLDVETVIAGGVERDRLLCTRAILVLNECEPIFTPRYEQKIKSAVDQETVTYRDLYTSTPMSRQRTALIIGTTNKPELFTGSLGTRKVWQIPVRLCDSMLIKNMDKQQLFAEIKATLAKWRVDNPGKSVQMAWNLGKYELEINEETNREAKGAVGLYSLLIEVFGDPAEAVFDPRDYTSDLGRFSPRTGTPRMGNPYDLSNKPNVWTATKLLRYMRDQFPDDKVDRKALVYAMIEYCSAFTKTSATKINTYFTDRTFAARDIKAGQVKVSSSERYFLFPTIGEDTDLSEDTEENLQ